MDDDQSFERQQGMDERVFPGELWLLYQATGSHTWLTAGAELDGARWPYKPRRVTRVDPTDIGFNRRDELWQRIPADGRDKLQKTCS